MKSIVIPDSVVSIGNLAFYRCTGLEEVSVGSGLTDLCGDAFSECTGLAYTVYGNCNYLGNESNPYIVLVSCVNPNFSDYTIHENTKFIQDRAFQNCYGLTEVVLPSGLLGIGNYAFYQCERLSKVVLSDGLNTIGAYAFQKCKKLSSVTVAAQSDWELQKYGWSSTAYLTADALSDSATFAVSLYAKYYEYIWYRVK
jgi:hypothetical protein